MSRYWIHDIFLSGSIALLEILFMTVFDILSQMEAYAQAFPAMNTIISVMDRSLPYEAASGSYNTPEKSDVRYLVDEFLTSERGFSSSSSRSMFIPARAMMR